MSILSWLSAILPKLNKSNVEEDLKASLDELRDTFIPGYADAARVFSAMKFNSKEAERLDMIFSGGYDHPKGVQKTKNIITDINALSSNLKENLEYLFEIVDNNLEELILRDGLTLYKAKVLRSCEQISWVTRFGVNLIDFIYGCECKAKGGNPDFFDFSPRTVKTIYEEVKTFARLISVYGVKPEEFKKTLSKIPEVIYNAQTANSVAAIVGDVSDDVGGINSLEFSQSPIFRIGMLWAEWQGYRYRCMKNRKQMLAYRVLYIQSLLEGTSDPKLEHEMKVLQGWIEDLEYKMKKLEED